MVHNREKRFFVFIHDAFDVEGLGEGETLFASMKKRGGIGEQSAETGCQSVCVFGVVEEAVLAVCHEVGETACAANDESESAG